MLAQKLSAKSFDSDPRLHAQVLAGTRPQERGGLNLQRNLQRFSLSPTIRRLHGVSTPVARMREQTSSTYPNKHESGYYCGIATRDCGDAPRPALPTSANRGASELSRCESKF